jgi:hypothetical protein
MLAISLEMGSLTKGRHDNRPEMVDLPFSGEVLFSSRGFWFPH